MNELCVSNGSSLAEDTKGCAAGRMGSIYRTLRWLGALSDQINLCRYRGQEGPVKFDNLGEYYAVRKMGTVIAV